MAVTYNFYLVVLSALIAMLASYVTLEIAGQVGAAQGFERKFWLTVGAIDMGVGIWSMHFIAMLAFSIPIYIHYNLLIVLVSLLAAVLASGQALFIVSRPIINLPTLLIGSTCMGIAIAGMHYIGMAAMEMRADINYNPNLFALSIAIAIVVSLVALKLSFKFRNTTGFEGKGGKIVSAIIMGAAVLSMHYTGMAAAMFKPADNKVVEVSSIDLSTIGYIVSIVTFVILGLTLIIVYANSEPREFQK